MANCDTFTCFSYLPFEIRRLIWQEALSVPALWVAHCDPPPIGPIISIEVPLKMTFTGPTPYLVGLSCREARRVMEASYMQFDSLEGGPSASHWVNVDQTVVFVGKHPRAAQAVLTRFRADEVARFKHVALDAHAADYPPPRVRLRENIQPSDLDRPVLEHLIIGRIEDVADDYANIVADDDESAGSTRQPMEVFFGDGEAGTEWSWFCTALIQC